VKWIFLSLLMLNGAYAGWYFGLAEKGESATSSAGQQVVQLNNLQMIQKATSTKVSQVSPEEKNSCKKLGPVKDKLNADQIQTRLAALDIEAQVIRQNSEVVKDYWVYLNPLPNKKSAKSKLAELQSKGIDSYLISSGDLANGISLGLFSRKGNAVAQKSKIEALGYSVRIKENKKRDTAYWVSLDREGTGFFNNGILESLKTRFPELTVDGAICYS